MTDRTVIALCVIALLLMMIFTWILPSSCEARAYNRLTDGNATTWDAMFVQLRVQGSE